MAGRCGKIEAGRDGACGMAPPLRRGRLSRYPLRWMAAQQLSIVLVKAQSGKYKHDDHNDQRQNLVICHYATSFVQDVRKGGEKPGAISQPCLAAKPPFLPGVTPTAILACARPHCQRRPPCGGRRFVCRSGRNIATAHGNRRFGRLYRSGGAGNRHSGERCRFAGNAVRGIASGKTVAPLPRGRFRAAAAVFRPTACGARPAVPGGCFSGSCSAGAARPAFPAGPRPRQAAPRARARPPRGRDRRRW